jgi:glutathione S-transferase
MICAYEAGLADRLALVRSVTSMLRPNLPLMQLNPWNKIPTLVTESGQVLFDSDVIIEYLDSLHTGTKLHPAESSARWQALRWRSSGNAMLDALILWRNECERPADRQLPVLLDAFRLKVQMGFALLEREAVQLAQAAYSVGHIAIGCALGYVDFRFSEIDWRAASPRLAAWSEVFGQRRSSQLTVPIDDSRQARPDAAPATSAAV